jgi:hypothetical protein
MMTIEEAIAARRSIRRFKPDPIPRASRLEGKLIDAPKVLVEGKRLPLVPLKEDSVSDSMISSIF